MIRLRIERHNWPRPGLYRPGLYLTDTPRPDCRDCDGEGGFEYDYGDHNGEYADTDWEPCGCWNENRRWLLLRLPHRPRWMRRPDDGRDPWEPGDHNSEPPF
ncbi:hypothetical protein [Streptomyces sp. NPDC001492]